jgi:hypothetical protein
MWTNNARPINASKKRALIEVRKCVPTMIICDPPEKFSLETKHQFEATKMYLMTDNNGSEFGIVICPTHQLPISVKPVHRSVTC